MERSLYPLLLADHQDWRHHSTYSAYVREILLATFRAFDLVGYSDAGFAQIFTLIRPYLDAPMCRHQRLRLSYFAARAHASAGAHEAALYWLDRALDLDSELRDTADLAYLHFLRGSVNRRMLRLGRAADDHRTCLALLGDQSRSRFHDSAFKLEVLAQLAGFEIYRAHFWEGQQLLAEAQRLLDFVPAGSLARGTLAWMRALLARWSGRLDDALRDATLAASAFAASGNAASQARILLHLADCLLDRGSSYPHASDACSAAVAQAQRHLRLALGKAQEAQDAIGVQLVLLADVRAGRMANTVRSPFVVIEAAFRAAHHLDDDALRAQGLTVLAEELDARGEHDAALNRYRDVLHVLDGSDVPAAGIWAQRALRLAEEMTL
ncbi:MAG: hypothetical protein ACHQ4H_12635 [Ktedonobacterales bacterium]